MKPQDKLFSLIKSLSIAEKIQFKKYVNKLGDGSDKQYITLFTQIDKQKEFNESALALENIKSLSYTKHYLYNALLDFLESYDDTDSINDLLNKHIKKIKILYAKGMYHESKDLLNEAKEKAEAYELFLKIIELCDLELQLISKIHTKNLQQYFEKIIRDKKTAQEKNKNQTEYFSIFSELNNFYNQYLLLRNEDSLKDLENLMNTPIMRDYTLAQSFFAQFYYYASHQLYCGIIKKDSFELIQQHVQLWKTNLLMAQKNSATYFNVLSTYMLACYQKQDYKELSCILKLAEAIVPLSENDKINFAYRLYKHKFDILLKKGEITQLCYIGEEASKKLHLIYKMPVFYSRLYIGMEFSLATSYFLAHENKKAIKHIIAIINNVQAEQERWQYMYYASKMFQLLIVYEMGDHHYLADLIDACKKYFKRHELLSPLHNLFLNHFKSLVNAFDKADELAAFKILKTNIAAHINSSQLFALFNFDISIWIDSKIENTPMSQIISKRSRAECPEIFEVDIKQGMG